MTDYVAKVCSKVVSGRSRFLPSFRSVYHKQNPVVPSGQKNSTSEEGKILESPAGSDENTESESESECELPDKEECFNHLESSAISVEKKQDEIDRDIFKESGLSPNIVNSMCRANIPASGITVKEFDGKHFQVPFQKSSFKKLHIIDKGTYKHFGGKWTDFMRKLVETTNKYCIWNFKKNVIKVKGSRKKDQGQFFKGKAICKKPECPCEAYLTIDEEFSNTLKVTFKGNVRHDVTKPVSLKDNTGDLKSPCKVFFVKIG